GEHAWVRDPMGVHDVDERMIRDLEASFRRDTIALLLAAESGTVRTRLLPDVKDAGGKLYHALELSSRELDPLVLHIGPSTNLIVKQTYVAGAPGQPLIEERFGDYKPVDGVQVAFTATATSGGRRLGERRVSEIKINAPLDPSLFKRPAS